MSRPTRSSRCSRSSRSTRSSRSSGYPRNSGPQGVQGIQGIQGVQGLTGSTGLQGPPGVPCDSCVTTGSIMTGAITGDSISKNTLWADHFSPSIVEKIITPDTTVTYFTGPLTTSISAVGTQSVTIPTSCWTYSMVPGMSFTYQTRGGIIDVVFDMGFYTSTALGGASVLLNIDSVAVSGKTSTTPTWGNAVPLSVFWNGWLPPGNHNFEVGWCCIAAGGNDCATGGSPPLYRWFIIKEVLR